MKFKRIMSRVTLFKLLNIGDVFLYGDEPYMKLNENETLYGNNAVFLGNGNLIHFSPEAEVLPKPEAVLEV